MRVQQIDAFGLEHLGPAERPDPIAGPGEVLLELRAASLNYRDLLMVEGLYDPRQKLPLIPCSDGVGRVVDVGPGVQRVEIGDRVTPLFAQAWLAGAPRREYLRSTLGGPLDGTLAERLVVPEEALCPAPDHLTDDEAASLPCAALTAWNAVVRHGRLAPGQTVLLEGTGGVSLFALQFARLAGGRVIATSSRDEKLERCRELGAWETINYRTTPEWGRVARRLAGGEGVDLVVDVGGAGTLPQALAAVRPGGTIAVIGVLAGRSGPLDLAPILMRNVRLQGIMVGNREDYEAMLAAIARHEIHPVLDRSFPLSEARQAFDHLAAGRHFGKITIEIGRRSPAPDRARATRPRRPRD